MAVVTTYPVNLTYNYGPKVGTNNLGYSTSDGIFYNISPLLSAVKDVSFNQKTLSVLSNNFLLSDSLSATNYLLNQTDYITETTLNVNGNYLVASTTPGSAITASTSLSAATVFTIQFNNDYSVSFLYAGNYLTRNSTSVLSMSGYNSNNFPTTQSFYYSLHNGQIVLFTVADGLVVYLSTNLQLTTFAGFNSASNVITLDRFTSTFLKKLGTTSNVSYLPTTNSIDVAQATTNLPHNYLITVPYENTNTINNTLDYNITTLKNYYSPEHVQTPTLSSQLRAYNRLYTGLNTANGNDKIYLSYLGNEITKIFTKDNDTYFHYPDSALAIPLSASTLVLAGATPGSSPWRSDRIFVKQADYKAYSPWGNFNGIQNGEFFCSWLSAGNTGVQPVWMDRYFNPSRVNLTAVLSSAGVGPSNNSRPDLIWDVPSTQILNPDCLYVYHKIGNKDNTDVVNNLQSTLSHQIAGWTNPLYDAGKGTFTGVVYNLSASNVRTFTNTKYPALDTSKSYATLELNNNDFYVPGFTLTFQAYNNDWTNIQGDQIIGNYYNGGIGLFKNNPILTPFITIVGNHINTLNTNLYSLYNTSLAPVGYNNTILKSNYNETYFILDAFHNVYEYDQDGVKISQFTLSNITGTLLGSQLIYKNGYREIFVATTSSNVVNWYTFTTAGSALSAGTSPAGYNNYGLDLYNNIYYFNGTGNAAVDNNNVVFALSGDKLVRGLTPGINPGCSQFILSAYNAENINIDVDNNIWILYNGRSLSKLDNYGRIIWDVNVSSDQFLTNSTGALLNTKRIINFAAQLNPNSNMPSYYGIILDGKTQNIHKVDPDTGIVLQRYNATPFTYNTLSAAPLECRPAGDSTGYDYQRKFVYDVNSNPNALKLKALIENTSTLSQDSYSYELDYDASILTPGWHHFAITIDPYNMLKLYVDSTVVASTSVGSLSAGVYRIYNQRNNPDLVIGTSSFKTQTLALFTTLAKDPYAFNGYLADIRIYSQALQKADISALQRNFHTDSYTDLNWSSPAGSRYYIEQIDRFFPHRMPGAKSSLFNIKIKNSNISDPVIRNIIEKNIIAALSKTIPVYTQLNNIIWQ